MCVPVNIDPPATNGVNIFIAIVIEQVNAFPRVTATGSSAVFI
jgi:hypothetical protein